MLMPPHAVAMPDNCPRSPGQVAYNATWKVSRAASFSHTNGARSSKNAAKHDCTMCNGKCSRCRGQEVLQDRQCDGRRWTHRPQRKAKITTRHDPRHLLCDDMLASTNVASRQAPSTPTPAAARASARRGPEVSRHPNSKASTTCRSLDGVAEAPSKAMRQVNKHSLRGLARTTASAKLVNLSLPSFRCIRGLHTARPLAAATAAKAQS